MRYFKATITFTVDIRATNEEVALVIANRAIPSDTNFILSSEQGQGTGCFDITNSIEVIENKDSLIRKEAYEY
jgi:hypothetical protein